MSRHASILIASLLSLLAACATTLPSHEATVLAWQDQRLAALKQPDSYLNIVGLHWLKPGTTSFGGSEDADIRMPTDTQGLLGRFDFDGDAVVMHVAAGETVRAGGSPVDAPVLMHDDATGSPVTAQYGNLSWVVIERNGRHGVRVRDEQHPVVAAFGPLPYYPIDPSYRVQGRLLRYPEPKTVRVGTVIEGLGWEPQSPGVVEFTFAGETHRLEAYASATDQLFFVFGDRTNGRETYPAGRFLYADDPGEGETVELDFNKSYSPPCAFNDFSTCPVATPANRLAFPVMAGELYDRSLGPQATD